MRIVAVDWSGRKNGEHRSIWTAEARGTDLLRLEDGRTRDQLADHLLDLARQSPDLVVGMDFSFSLPSWFLADRGYADAAELWAAAALHGETWLRDCSWPFWGRPGRQRPSLPAHVRVTETALPSYNGVRPKSTFQVGGAGSVGTGSIRGFPVLARLQRGGFAIWPFDPPRPPMVVEVWPRSCTGAVVKRDPVARAALLDERFPHLAADLRARAVGNEDAFDAAVTALVMATRAHEFATLAPPADPAARLEGWAWMP